MAEVTDYTKYLPLRPPENVIKEIREGYFTANYIVYKQELDYDEFAGKNVQAAYCRCTSCGEGYYAEKVKRPTRDWGSVFFGFIDGVSGSPVYDEDITMCPICGEEAKALHSSHLTNDGYGSIFQTKYPVTVHNIKGGLALLYWEVRRYINKDGQETIITVPYDGYIFRGKKKICVTGREQAFFQKRYLYQWKQLKRYRVDVGPSVGEDIFFIDPLEGTEAENCKLDMYCDTDADVLPVRYMELWMKYPNIENLVMQGFGEYVNHLMDKAVVYNWNGYVCRTRKISEWLNLKKTKPHEILGISKEEFRAIREKQLDSKEIDYYLKVRNMGVTVQNLKKAMKRCSISLAERFSPYSADLFKIFRYIKKQKEKYPKDDNDLTMLADYWAMAKENGEDVTRNDVLFPVRLKNAHDTAIRQKKWKEDEKRRSQFINRYKELCGFCYSSEGLSIHPAATENEMIVEGKILNHCVATYAARHADGETSIFFIRHEDKPYEPYFTLEFDFRNMRVVQNRGLKNCARTPEVEEFEKKWVKFVKQAAAKERKAA